VRRRRGKEDKRKNNNRDTTERLPALEQNRRWGRKRCAHKHLVHLINKREESEGGNEGAKGEKTRQEDGEEKKRELPSATVP
jgi:hypothetical protein